MSIARVFALAGTVALGLAPVQVLGQAAAPEQKSAVQAAPPVGAAPSTTASTYGDWVLGCQQVAGATARRCEISQAIQVQGAGRIAQLVLGRIDPKSPLTLTIMLPSNVSLTQGVRVSIDDKDQPVELLWRRCLPIGCFANLEIKDDVIKRYRAQADQGRFQFRDGVGQEITLPFSFRGFAQAFDAMAKG